MSDLRQLQRALQAHLLASDADDARAVLDAMIVETDNVARDVRLHIYSNAYRTRLVDALSADFNGLHAYLGDEAFAQLVHAYIAQYPSHYFSLRGVGGDLAKFLRAAEPYAVHVELCELAEFEWVLCHAFDAADARCATAADFSRLAPAQWAELTLQFVPALRAIELRSNVPALWKALHDGQALPAVAVNLKPLHWIVWRRDLTLLFRPLEGAENIAFDLFAAGATFADVCGELAAQLPEDEVPQRVASALQQWLHDGLVAAR